MSDAFERGTPGRPRHPLLDMLSPVTTAIAAYM
jgi:hypothetical protein